MIEKPPIATIINFCTIEARFIQACIEQCRYFSQQIIVPVCDHFFNGLPENRERLNEIYSAFHDCQFIEYPFIPNRISRKLLNQVTREHFWHCASRFVGSSLIDDHIETVLFLDADEVPDGKKFSKWLLSSDYSDHSVMKFSNYWYFREPRYQSLHFEDSIVLAQKRILSPSVLLQPSERDAIYDLLPGPKRREATDFDGMPMFHHFSWVRTKDEMLNKVRSWGHRDDRNWEELVEKEFAAPFSGTDFVHHYRFQECDPVFHISMNSPVFSSDSKGPAQVVRLNEDELLEDFKPLQKPWWRKFWIRKFE